MKLAVPKVSIYVPCYNFAHLLPECVESILAQTYGDFEVLIMDDCSPDNTAEVAAGFRDPRVTYIRNQPNLGHLRNYNKGIGLARGQYVWQLSGDDRLHCNHILHRYVELMDANPNVAYVFCPGFELRGSRETGVMTGSVYRQHDAIFRGRQFLQDLLQENFVLAGAGMVRKKCYERVGVFPLDLPYAADWYLWCALALHYDVGYLAEPMVDYRVHELAMTTMMSQSNIRAFIEDDIAVPWRIWQEAKRIGADEVVKACREQVAYQCGRYLAAAEIRGATAQIEVEEFENRLAGFSDQPADLHEIASSAFMIAGDRYYWRHNFADALSMYSRALSVRPFWPSAWAKAALARTGNFGMACRKAMASLRAKHHHA